MTGEVPLTCSGGGTSLKLMNWKGIQSFQLAITAGRRSCCSLGLIWLVLPCSKSDRFSNGHNSHALPRPWPPTSSVRRHVKKVPMKNGANSSWSSPSRCSAPADTVHDFGKAQGNASFSRRQDTLGWRREHWTLSTSLPTFPVADTMRPSVPYQKCRAGPTRTRPCSHVKSL